MNDIEAYEHTDMSGNHIKVILQCDDRPTRWKVSSYVNDEHSWTVSHNPELLSDRSRMLFNEEEARKEFERWRPNGVQNTISDAVKSGVNKDELDPLEFAEFKLSDELIHHIGDLIHEVVMDDPMFLSEVGPHAEKSWDKIQTLRSWATRAILHGIAKSLI